MRFNVTSLLLLSLVVIGSANAQEVTHLMPVSDRMILCATRVAGGVWYGGEGGAVCHTDLIDSITPYQLPTSSDVVRVYAYSGGILAQSREHHLYVKARDSDSFTRASDYGEDCTLLGIHDDVVYVHHSNSGLASYDASGGRRVLATLPGAVRCGFVYDSPTGAKAFMLGMNGEVVSWTGGTSADTLWTMPIPTVADYFARLVVLGNDTCLVGTWQGTYMVTRDGVQPFVNDGFHVRSSFDSVVTVQLYTEGVLHHALPSLFVYLITGNGDRRQAIVRREMGSTQWRVLNNRDSLIQDLLASIPDEDTLLAFGIGGRIYEGVMTSATSFVRLRSIGPATTAYSKWDSYVPFFLGDTLKIVGVRAESTSDSSISGVRLRFADYITGSASGLIIDSMTTCLTTPDNYLVSTNFDNQYSYIITEGDSDSLAGSLIHNTTEVATACTISPSYPILGVWQDSQYVYLTSYREISEFSVATGAWRTLLQTTGSFVALQKVNDTILVAGTLTPSAVAFIAMSTDNGSTWLSDTLWSDTARRYAFIGTRVFVMGFQLPGRPKVHIVEWTPQTGVVGAIIDSTRHNLTVRPTQIFSHDSYLYLVPDDGAEVYKVRGDSIQRIPLNLNPEQHVDAQKVFGALLHNTLYYFTKQRVYTLKLDAVTSISIGEVGSNIAVYLDTYGLHPNPTGGAIAVSVELAAGAVASETEIILVDLLGNTCARLTDEMPLTDSRIQVYRATLPQQLTSGMYYLVVRSADVTKVMPLALQR